MLYVIIMFFSGCLIAMQAPVNAAMSRHTGALESSLINFLVGAAALALIVLFMGKGSLAKAVQAPWQCWTGGLMGASMVVAAIVSVPRIGVLSMALAMIAGNLAMAAIIDNFGWFGAPVVPFGWRRALGFCFVLAGLYFIFRRGV